MDPETPPSENTEKAAAETVAEKAPQKTPESKPEIKVTDELREKYKDADTENLLAEIAKWSTLSRSNEDRSKENHNELKNTQAVLAETKKQAETAQAELEKATKELAALKAEKAEIEINSIRTKLLVAQGLNPETDAVFITGTTEEDIKKSVEALAARVGAGAKESPRKNIIPEAGSAKAPGIPGVKDRYSAYLSGNL